MHRLAFRGVLKGQLGIEGMLIEHNFPLVDDQAMPLAADELLAGAGRQIQQDLQPVGRCPVVGILKEKRVVAGVGDDFLDQPVGPEFSSERSKVTPGNFSSVAVGGVEEQSSMTTIPCSGRDWRTSESMAASRYSSAS